MESFKDMFLEEREHEMISLTSAEQTEKKQFDILEYLRGQNFNLTKLKKHERLFDSNLHDGCNPNDNGIRICKKNTGSRHSDVDTVAMDSTRSITD